MSGKADNCNLAECAPKPETTTPVCQGVMAQFPTEAHARYVAEGHAVEFGGDWQIAKHQDHWHIREKP